MKNLKWILQSHGIHYMLKLVNCYSILLFLIYWKENVLMSEVLETQAELFHFCGKLQVIMGKGNK